MGAFAIHKLTASAVRAHIRMPVRVPMDRAPFPPLRPQSEENEQLEALATLLIDEYVEQYDHFQLQTYGLVRTDWSPLVLRDGLDIYQQRKASSSPQERELEMPRLLATGTLPCSLDDVMFALLAPTSEAMHVKMAGMRGDDVDGLVLHTVTPVMPDEPFRYCGVKWLVRQPPMGYQTIVRKRDFVFLEATGIRIRPGGERIGYHLCHSIEFATTPPLLRRGIVRGKMATCHFYRQMASAKVDVWAVATLDMQGKMWRRVALAEGATAVGAIRDLPALAVTKKLMWFEENRPPHLTPRESIHIPSHLLSKRSNYKCYNCGHGSRWSWKKLRQCDLCEFTVCSKCSDLISVFPTGLDPRTNREIRCSCVACLLSLSGHNHAIYASQSCLDPSQRGSTPSTGALCEDIRPKYDKTRSKFLTKKTNKTLRLRACSGDSGTTLTSSVVSRQSTVAIPEPMIVREMSGLDPQVALLHRRSLTRFTLTDTLRHLQAVADSTYSVQQQNVERFALAAVHEHSSRIRATTTPTGY